MIILREWAVGYRRGDLAWFECYFWVACFGGPELDMIGLPAADMVVGGDLYCGHGTVYLPVTWRLANLSPDSKLRLPAGEVCLNMKGG
jgi:hypothetical protein